MNTMTSRRHVLICGVLTAMAAALIIGWYLLSDLDASTKAAQMGAMIAVIAAVSTAPVVRVRRRGPQDTEGGAAGDAGSTKQ